MIRPIWCSAAVAALALESFFCSSLAAQTVTPTSPRSGGNITVSPLNPGRDVLPGNDVIDLPGIRAPGAASGRGSNIVVEPLKPHALPEHKAPTPPKKKYPQSNVLAGDEEESVLTKRRKEEDVDDHLIPFKYKKYVAQGLYRPWTHVPDHTYWYGAKYHPWTPGSRTLYSTKDNNPNYVPFNAQPYSATQVVEGAANATPNPSVPGGEVIAPAAPAAGPMVAQGPNYAPQQYAPQTHYAPAQQYAPQTQYAPGMMVAPQPLPSGPAPQMAGAPCCGQAAHPGYAPNPHYNPDPGFWDVNYRPRHAGSYSPYVGYYGYGGRYNYGYGPYNYQWSGGYSGFGRNGSFNYWLPQSGLQY